MQKKTNPSKEISKKAKTPNKAKTTRKITNKEKAQFSEQSRVDMYPVDPYND